MASKKNWLVTVLVLFRSKASRFALLPLLHRHLFSYGLAGCPNGKTERSGIPAILVLKGIKVCQNFQVFWISVSLEKFKKHQKDSRQVGSRYPTWHFIWSCLWKSMETNTANNSKLYKLQVSFLKSSQYLSKSFSSCLYTHFNNNWLRRIPVTRQYNSSIFSIDCNCRK